MVEPAVRSYLASRANHVAGSLRRKVPFPLDDLRGFIWFLSRERLSVEEGGYGNTSIYRIFRPFVHKTSHHQGCWGG